MRVAPYNKMDYFRHEKTTVNFTKKYYDDALITILLMSLIWEKQVLSFAALLLVEYR